MPRPGSSSIVRARYDCWFHSSGATVASRSRYSTTPPGSSRGRSDWMPKCVRARWPASARALYRNPCTAAEFDGLPYFFIPIEPWVTLPAK